MVQLLRHVQAFTTIHRAAAVTRSHPAAGSRNAVFPQDIFLGLHGCAQRSHSRLRRRLRLRLRSHWLLQMYNASTAEIPTAIQDIGRDLPC
jgi:hypothetical protein